MANIPTHVIFRGRKTRVLGWHSPSKRWILDNPGYESAPHFVPNERVIHVKPKKKNLEKRDSQYTKRKHLAAGLAYTGAGIGLSALAARGGASAVRHLKPLARYKKHANHLEGASTTLTTIGAGSGAVGSINFARIQNQEAKQKLSKMGEGTAAKYTVAMLDASQKITGKGGKRMKLRRLAGNATEKLATDASPLARGAAGISGLHKADSAYNDRLKSLKSRAAASSDTKYNEQSRPKAAVAAPSVTPKKMFDSERSRKRRSYVYEGGLAGGAVGAAANAARPASADLKEGRNRVKAHVAGYKANMAESERLFMAMQDPAKTKSKGAHAGHAYRKLKAAGENMAAAGRGYKANAPKEKILLRSRGKWGAAAVGLAAGAAAVHHNRNNGGRTYSGWYDGKKGPKKLTPRNAT